MFGARWVLPWVWGAGLGGSGPPTPATEGPFWISNYHMITPRCTPLIVREIQVLPGRVWSDDRTLMIFGWMEDDA